MPRKRVGKYSNKIREEAAIQYALHGNISKTARDMDIPVKTVQSWKGSDWWDALIAKVHQEKASEHRAMYSSIVDHAQAITLAKLPEATAAQANIIAATATDKVRLLDNMPTSISGRTDSLESLKDQFRKLSSTHTIVPNSTITDQKGPKDDKG